MSSFETKRLSDIKCQDGKIDNIGYDVIKYFITFRNIIEDTEDFEEIDQNSNLNIELYCPKKKIYVEKLIIFAKENIEHLDIPISHNDDIPDYISKYFFEDDNENVNLLEVSNFLDFKYMTETLCKYFGLQIRYLDAKKQKEVLKEFDN